MRIKSAVCLLLVLCLLAVSSLPVWADDNEPFTPSTLDELLANLPEDEEVFRAELSRLGITCTSHEMPQQNSLLRASLVEHPTTTLSISRGIATCTGRVKGDTSTTSVVIYLYLKKLENNSFQTKYSDHQEFSGRVGDFSYNKSIVSYGSGSYRVDGSYYLFTNSTYINPVENSGVVYY